MLELTKSMMRFSWAMSMLGVRQMANFINPSDGWDDAKDAMNAVNATITTIKKETKKSTGVSIVGFGSFQSVKRKARKGRNPQTGEQITIRASKAVRFRAGKAFKEAL